MHAQTCARAEPATTSPVDPSSPHAPPLDAHGYPLVARWYVVEAYEHSVENAYLRLAVAGLKVWMPVDMRRPANRAYTSQRRRDRPVPRFGRYFFVRCRMNEALQHAISTTPSVAGLLLAAHSDRPSPIPDHVIDWIRTSPPPRKVSEVARFVIGDVVRLLAGPFAGFQGPVEDVDKRGALRIGIDIFGRPTPVVVEVGHVEMVLLAKSRSISTFKRTGDAESRRVR